MISTAKLIVIACAIANKQPVSFEDEAKLTTADMATIEQIIADTDNCLPSKVEKLIQEAKSYEDLNGRQFAQPCQQCSTGGK